MRVSRQPLFSSKQVRNEKRNAKNKVFETVVYPRVSPARRGAVSASIKNTRTFLQPLGIIILKFYYMGMQVASGSLEGGGGGRVLGRGWEASASEVPTYYKSACSRSPVQRRRGYAITADDAWASAVIGGSGGGGGYRATMISPTFAKPTRPSGAVTTDMMMTMTMPVIGTACGGRTAPHTTV